MSPLKSWAARIFTAAAIALLVCQGVFVINPIVDENTVTDGYCHVKQLKWTKAKCLRSNTVSTYDVPSLSGNFWRHMNPTFQTFTRLSVDSDNVFHYNFTALGLKDANGFLVDDLSNKALLNCSNASITSTKQLLVDYLPVFKDVLDVSSQTNHRPKYYPNKFIDCSYRNNTHVYLRYKRLNKFLVIPFIINFFLVGIGLDFLLDHEEDGLIKECSGLFVMPFYLLCFLLHAIFYVLVVGIIGWTIFNIEPTLSLEESFNKGSILIVFKWVGRKIKKCCQPSGSSSS